MERSKCRHENPDDQKFCGKCGQALSEARGIFGEPLKTSRSEGERRQATIVFSALSGYTAMDEGLDREEVRGFLAPAGVSPVVSVIRD